jgi:hypothetical protein
VRAARPSAFAGQADVPDQIVDGHLEDTRQSGQVVERRLPVILLPAQDQAVVSMDAIGQPAQRRPTPAAQSSEPCAEALAREHAQTAMSGLAFRELELDVDSALKRAHLEMHPWAQEVTLDGALAAAAQDLLPAEDRHYLSAVWAQIMGAG